MKKIKSILGLAFTLTITALLAVIPAQAAFTDVQPADWYYDSVTRFAQTGIISGYSDGTFRPEGTVTHAEFIAMLVRAVSGDTVSAAQGEHWAKGYIDRAAQLDMIPYFSDMQTDLPLTRDLAARYLVATADSVLQEPVISTVGIPEMITDNSGYSYYVRQAYGRGLISGYPDGSFRPNNTLTRSEAAALILRLVDAEERLAVRVVYADDFFSGSMTIGGNTISLGMKIDSLIALAGQPDEVLASDYDLQWYIYGTKDYRGFYMAECIPSGEIVRIYAAGDYSIDEQGKSTLTRYTDIHGGDKEYAAMLSIESVTGLGNGGGEMMKERVDENERLSFHVANAFRVFHGLSPARWDTSAAQATRYKAEDMANNNYYSHFSPSGTGPSDLAKRFGANYLGENIAGGQGGGFYAAHSWISSAGHRTNILNSAAGGMAVGAAYNYGSQYTRYFAMMLTKM